ncbi:MAG: metallophosphoesterase [Actinomycetota bacterium]
MLNGRRTSLALLVALTFLGALLPAPPARAVSPVFTDGFESGDLSKWTSATGIVVQGAEVASGSWAARATSTGTPSYALKSLGSTHQELYYRANLKVLGQGSHPLTLLWFRTAAGSNLLNLRMNPSGALQVWNFIRSSSVATSGSITKGRWYDVQVRLKVNGSQSQVQVWLDGATVLNKTLSLGTTPIGGLLLGEPNTGRSYDVAFDDVVASTAFVTPDDPPDDPPDVPPGDPPGSAVFTDGFESGDLSKWTSSTGITVQGTEVASGSWAARATSTGTPSYALKSLGSTHQELYYRANLKVLGQGSHPLTLLWFRTAAGSNLLNLRMNPSGALQVWNFIRSSSVATSGSITKGRWYDVQVRLKVNGSQSQVQVWLDGATVLNKTLSLGTTPIGGLLLGEPNTGRSYDVAFDDVVASTAFVTPDDPPDDPPGPTDPVIAAAGDIACDPTSPDFNGGVGTATACRQMATSDLLVNGGFDAVLTLGDNQYEDGTLTEFLNSYDPSWGRVKAKTHPAVGNHEYHVPGAAGYFDYFGAAAGDRTKGYYSFDIGDWHVIVINSQCGAVGGCGTGSPQLTWLAQDLAAEASHACTLAYWHHPRFSSGPHGNQTAMAAVWQTLYQHGVDVVLNGHDHAYERFAEQDPSAQPDPQSGIRQFTVGTGGNSLYPFLTVQPNSEVRNSTTFGVLQMELHPSSYEWEFLPVPGSSFTDSGTDSCH